MMLYVKFIPSKLKKFKITQTQKNQVIKMNWYLIPYHPTYLSQNKYNKLSYEIYSQAYAKHKLC